MTTLPRIQWKQCALIVALIVLLVGGLFTLIQQPPGKAHATYTHRAASTPYKVLFDDDHAETAGNADWVISSSRPDPLRGKPQSTGGDRLDWRSEFVGCRTAKDWSL